MELKRKIKIKFNEYNQKPHPESLNEIIAKSHPENA